MIWKSYIAMDDDDGLGDFFADVGDAAVEGAAVAKAAEAPPKPPAPVRAATTIPRPAAPAQQRFGSGAGAGGGGTGRGGTGKSKGGGRFFEEDDGLSAYATRAGASEPAAATALRSRHAPQQWSKGVLPLEPLDHSTITYEPFQRVFYRAKTVVPRQEVECRRAELGVLVKGEPHGSAGVAPLSGFMESQLPAKVLRTLAAKGFERPTAVQAQSLPLAMQGHNLVALAPTGSGKTLAFTLPMLAHICDQRRLRPGEAAVGLVLAPTRELAAQIGREVKRFAKPLKVRVCVISGGESAWEQKKALEKGAEVVVATPGRWVWGVGSKQWRQR